MTLEDDCAYTIFQFVCAACGRKNEYLHEHRPSAKPHLITTSCQHCHLPNELGGITGVRVPKLRQAQPTRIAES
jgi:hypothetical protein